MPDENEFLYKDIPTKAERESSVPADTSVFPIHWIALAGNPLDNPELNELLNSMTMLSPSDIRGYVENFFDEIQAVSAKTLRSLAKIGEMMEDIGQWDFATLIALFDTKAPNDDFVEHDQDNIRHMTDNDYARLELIDDLLAELDYFKIYFGNWLTMVQNAVDGLVITTQDLIQNLSEHISDNDRHFIDGGEKESVINSALNFDNDLLMKGCTITTTVEELTNSTIVSESAYKNMVDELDNDIGWEFARRETIIANDLITITTSFNLDGLGGNIRTAIATLKIDENGIVKEVV